jgi:hypothetical protein
MIQTNAVGVGEAFSLAKEKTFQAIVTGTGAVSATVDIEVSVFGGSDPVNWQRLATIELSGNDSDSDGFEDTTAWPLSRANVVKLSVGASVLVGAGD